MPDKLGGWDFNGRNREYSEKENNEDEYDGADGDLANSENLINQALGIDETVDQKWLKE